MNSLDLVDAFQLKQQPVIYNQIDAKTAVQQSNFFIELAVAAGA